VGSQASKEEAQDNLARRENSWAKKIAHATKKNWFFYNQFLFLRNMICGSPFVKELHQNSPFKNQHLEIIKMLNEVEKSNRAN